MTLATRIRVLDPVPSRAVFDEFRRLLGIPVEARWIDNDGPDADYQRVWVEPDQGFAAWLRVTAARDKPLDGDTDGILEQRAPEATIEVVLDTAYGYQDDRDRGCGDLHVDLINLFAEWCTDRRVRVRWQSEWTGVWHDVPATVEAMVPR